MIRRLFRLSIIGMYLTLGLPDPKKSCKPMPEFPDSPLSSGDVLASYSIAECPDYDDVKVTHIDINSDGYIDFTFERRGRYPISGSRERYCTVPLF